jgi:hypothetical protein
MDASTENTSYYRRTRTCSPKALAQINAAVIATASSIYSLLPREFTASRCQLRHADIYAQRHVAAPTRSTYLSRGCNIHPWFQACSACGLSWPRIFTLDNSLARMTTSRVLVSVSLRAAGASKKSVSLSALPVGQHHDSPFPRAMRRRGVKRVRPRSPLRLLHVAWSIQGSLSSRGVCQPCIAQKMPICEQGRLRSLTAKVMVISMRAERSCVRSPRCCPRIYRCQPYSSARPLDRVSM